MNIENKKIWLTGASSGIGETLAIMLAKQGAHLILSARNKDKLQALKNKLTHPELHLVVPLDLSKTDKLQTELPDIIKDIGPIDILINNGGIAQRGTALETELDVQRHVMEVNYFGTITLTQLILPSMIRVGKGMIVTVSSVAGKVGGKSMSGYSASKHAIIGYMDCLRAEESKSGIQVLTICPGFVQTQISVNAMTANGAAFGKVAGSIKNGIAVDDCAKQIIKAIVADKDEVIIGKGLSYWAPTIYRFFPTIFRKISASKNFRD